MALNTNDPEAELGTDIALVDELAPVWGLVTGRRNLAYALARRLSIDSLFYDPDFKCVDLTRYVNADLSAADVVRLRGQIVAAVTDDPRVESVTVTPTFTFASGTLDIPIEVETADGETFELVLRASDVTVQVLSVGGEEIPQVEAPPQNLVIKRGEKGDKGDAGAAGAGGGGGAGGITLDDPGEFGNAADPAAEVVVFEEAVPLGGLDTPITVTLTGRFSSASGTSRFRVRIGGSSEAADGTIAATVSTASSSFSSGTNSGAIANPGGTALVKVTIENGAAGQYGRMRDLVVTITD